MNKTIFTFAASALMLASIGNEAQAQSRLYPQLFD